MWPRDAAGMGGAAGHGAGRRDRLLAGASAERDAARSSDGDARKASRRGTAPASTASAPSSGERYDQYDLTAAHRTLAARHAGSMVTNLANGRSVEVYVNDRGPYVDGRVIDLSYGAARAIGMVGPGTAPVRIEVLDAPVQMASRRTTPLPALERPQRAAPPPAGRRPPNATAPPPAARGAGARTFTVDVATLSDAGRAEHLRSRIALKFSRRLRERARRRTGSLLSRPRRALRIVVRARAGAELVNRFGYPAVIADETPMRRLRAPRGARRAGVRARAARPPRAS